MIRITLANKDITKYVTLDSIEVSDSIKVKADTANLEMVVIGQDPHPRAGNVLEIWDDNTLEFRGPVLRKEQRIRNPRTFEYSLEASDFTRFFDRRLVSETYITGKRCREVIADIVSKYTIGFTINHVYHGPKLPEMAFDFIYPSQALDEIAEKVGYQWFIDFDRDIWFMPLIAMASPLPGNVLNLDTDIANYGDLVIREDTSALKNYIYLKDAKYKATLKQDTFGEVVSGILRFEYEPFVPASISAWQEEGYLKAWRWDSTVRAEPIDADLVNILRDGIDGEKGDGRGTEKDVYVNLDRGTIRFPDKYPLRKEERFRIQYYSATEQPQILFDLASQAEMQRRESYSGYLESGKYEYVMSEPALYTEKGEEAIAAMERVLARYRWPIIAGSFTSYLKGWRAGQYFHLKSTARGAYGQPLDELMFVQSVRKSATAAHTLG